MFKVINNKYLTKLSMCCLRKRLLKFIMKLMSFLKRIPKFYKVIVLNQIIQRKNVIEDQHLMQVK